MVLFNTLNNNDGSLVYSKNYVITLLPQEGRIVSFFAPGRYNGPPAVCNSTLHPLNYVNEKQICFGVFSRYWYDAWHTDLNFG